MHPWEVERNRLASATIDTGGDDLAVGDAVTGWGTTAVLAVSTVGLATVLVALGCRGSDLPAQLFRADLFRRYGFVVWDSQWFGGHPTMPYSIVAPAIGAVVGPVTVAILSGAVSAVLFDRITRSVFTGSRIAASSWFALSTVTNVVIGRVTFALGVALGLAAVLSLQRRRWLLGLVFAVACSAASPVAGVFLAVGLAGWCLADRARRGVAIAAVVAAVAPLAVVGLLFPGPGDFPYERWFFVCDLRSAPAVFSCPLATRSCGARRSSTPRLSA